MVPSLRLVLVLRFIIHVNSSLAELVTHKNSSTSLITFCHPIKCQGEITFCRTNFTKDICRACRPGTFMPTHVDSSLFRNDDRIPSCLNNGILECPPEAKQVYDTEDILPGCECDTSRGYVGQDIYLCHKTSLPPCSPGKQLDLNDICTDCPKDTYKDTRDYGPCKKAKSCEKEDRVTISIATSTANAVCGMKIKLHTPSKQRAGVATTTEKFRSSSEMATTYSISFGSQISTRSTTHSKDIDSIARTTTQEMFIANDSKKVDFDLLGLRNSTKSPRINAANHNTESRNSSTETWITMHWLILVTVLLIVVVMIILAMLLRYRHKRSDKPTQQVKLVVINNTIPSAIAPNESIHCTETSAMVNQCVQNYTKNL